MPWHNKKILVTGGASFIGSHLLDLLAAQGARRIRVVDDLSSGSLDNIRTLLDSGRVDFHEADLLTPGVAEAMTRDIDVVFHLAAIHGGRGFIDRHQAACSQNLALDGAVIRAAHQAGVEKFVFASSGCVYPTHLQRNVKKELYLTEEMVGPPYDADNTYGWAKLMGEMTLRAYHRDWGFKSVSCRFFTAYGERCLENHAVMAMIARAFVRQNPFEVWGDGRQIRNWTYVGDIVSGMARAAEVIEDGAAVNIGTEERIRVVDVAREILRFTGLDARIRFLKDMPTGPLNRVAANGLIGRLTGWRPRMKFIDGLHRTIDWYFKAKRIEKVRKSLDRMLTER